MATNTIFEFENYRHYILQNLKHGEQTRMAAEIDCQPSYLSRVLKGDINFSIEQGVLINEYFKHDKEEADFFLTLLMQERAGNKKTRDYFGNRISTLRQTRHRLQNELKQKFEISAHKKVVYYSSTDFPLIHILLSVLKSDQVYQLTEILGLELGRVKDVIEELTRMDLVRLVNKNYVVIEPHVHIGKDEVFAEIYHRNFRNWVGQKVRSNTDNFHFTGTFGLSHEGFEFIKEEFATTLRKVNKIVGPAPEECGAVLCLDAVKIRSR